MDHETENRDGARPGEEVHLIRHGHSRVPVRADASDYGYDDSYGPGSQGGEFNIRDVLAKIGNHKWLILCIAVVFTVGATIHAYRSKPVFKATTTIEVGKEQGAPVKPDEVIVQDSEFSPLGSLKTKIFVIQSDPLLEDVALDLHLDRNPHFWRSSTRSVSEAINAIIGRSPDEDGASTRVPEFNEPGSVAERSAASAPTDNSTGERYVDALRSGLIVEQIKDTQLLTISFTHTDPHIAASVANGVANVFIDRNFENKTEKFTNASNWLERTTGDLKWKVEHAEQALTEYMRDHSIYAVDGQETLTNNKLAELHDQALRAQIARMLKQSLFDEVKTGNLSELPESFADSKIADLQKRQEDLALLASQLSVTYGPLNPKVAEVQQQMTAVQGQIAESRKALGEKLKADYERAAHDEAALNTALGQAKSESSQQSQLAIQYRVLKQNVDTTKALYTEFLQRANQARIQVAEQHNNIRVIQPAKLPKSPAGSNLLATIGAAFFASLLLGAGLAFFIEYIDRSIRTVDDLVRYTQLPALAVIPVVPKLQSKKKRRLALGGKRTSLVEADEPTQFDASRLVALDDRSVAAEAYRGLRTSVLLSTADKPPKTILVTSGRSGEGKTTTVVNIAVSLAQLGARVLIVDCDLRKPTTHRLLGITPVHGLSTFLSRDVKVGGLIVRTEVENLYLLPCGPVPPNPAELISSERMKRLVKALEERFDHVLIDSPPLLHVTDPAILSTLVDGVILVVHGGKSTREEVHLACQELMSVGAKSFGVVLNNIDLKRGGYAEYYYRYAYPAANEAKQRTS